MTRWKTCWWTSPATCSDHKEATLLKEGDRAPEFSLPTDDGRTVSLSDFRGKTVVLYFYPKDDTPGCTKEACSFRDAYDLFLEKGAVVIGVSADSSASHQSFRKKYGLPFYLASDESHDMLKSYGAWKKKTLYGKSRMGIVRSTFVIDPTGTIRKIFSRVRPEDHAADVLILL